MTGLVTPSCIGRQFFATSVIWVHVREVNRKWKCSRKLMEMKVGGLAVKVTKKSLPY